MILLGSWISTEENEHAAIEIRNVHTLYLRLKE